MSALDLEWEAFRDAFTRFARHITQAKTVNINSADLRREAQRVAEQYFRQVKPLFDPTGMPETEHMLDLAFATILELSQNRNAATSYRKQISVIQKCIPKVSSYIVVNPGGAKQGTNHDADDAKIVATLENLIPTAALSYRQALVDLADPNRISFRGAAAEMREALRETLDHLAPDKEVEAVKGYAHEKDRTKPTMKQKVRFILKARGQSKSASEVPEQTVRTVDELIATLTRSVYEKSSVATHVATERKTVQQLKRYIATILHEILSL